MLCIIIRLTAIFYLNKGKFGTDVFDQALVEAGIGELLISLGFSVGSDYFQILYNLQEF